jgi:hypothetical protein
MTENQLNKIKRIAKSLDSNLECCDVTHVRRDDGKAEDIVVIVHKAGSLPHESDPVGKFHITPQGLTSSYGSWT